MRSLDGDRISVAVMGLSGVGKTTIARKLSSDSWFHYSVDYRIWTHYLGDELNDYLKALACEHPVLDELLRTDSISVEPRVHFNNLRATSVYMGMLGKPDEFGSDEVTFRERMATHANAEVAAMHDIPKFIKRSWDLYEYPHFIADLSGSLCEIVDPEDVHDPTLSMLDDNCVLVYIRATDAHKEELIRRAKVDPKPIYYRPEFLDEMIPQLLKEHGACAVTDISPKDVGRYLYEKLLEHRVSRYEKIAAKHAVTVEMDEVKSLGSEQDLLELLQSRSKVSKIIRQS